MNKALFRFSPFARSAILLTTLLGLLVVGATIAQMAFLSNIVNAIFLGHKTLSGVEPVLWLLLLCIVLRAFLVWLREMTVQQGAIRVKAALRQQLSSHLFALGPAYSTSEATGGLLATASEGIERLDAYFSRYLPQLLLSVLIPLVIVVYIFPLDWISAALLLITGPIIPLLMFMVGKYAEKHIQGQWLALSRMSATFLDSIQGLPTLKLFGRGKAVGDKVEQMSNAFGEKTLKMLRIAFLSGAVLEFMTAAAIGVVAVTLGIRLIDANISFASAFLVLLLTPEFYRPLRELGVSRHAGMEGKVAAQRLFEILETPLPNSVQATSQKHPIGPLTIRFHDVTYTYPGKDNPAVTDINLTLPAGTRTALVGRSGAGKSTLVNLLLRFIQEQSGHITVNDIPLSELSVEVWRESIALVPQRPYLFNDTIRANIRMARPDASEQDIQQAARLAGAEEFILQLSDGYETQIGERGARLSAGQAQRIAIARAFLKDAPLLILDEPTSSLDPKSELLIRQALSQLMQQRTVLIVAHRSNTIASAEQIVMLDNGKIVAIKESGEDLQLQGSILQSSPSLWGNLGQVGTRFSPSVGQWRILQQTDGLKRVPTCPRKDVDPPAIDRYAQRDRSNDMKTFLRLLSFVAPFRWRIALAILLGSAMIASNILLLGMAAYLIAASALGPLMVTLTIPIYIVQFTSVSRSGSRYAERLTAHKVTFHLLAHLRTWVYRHLEPLAPTYLHTQRSGDILTRLVSDVDELQNIYLRIISPIVVAILISLLTFALFAIFSPVLAWVAFAFLVVTGFGVPLLTGLLSRGLGKRQLAIRAEMNAHLVDGIQGVQDLLAYGQAEAYTKTLAELQKKLDKIQQRMTRIADLQQTLNDLLMNLALWSLLILAIPLVVTKAIDGVYLAFLALVILASFEAVQPLGQAFQMLGHSVAAGERLFNITDAIPTVQEPVSPLPVPETTSKGVSLKFDHIHFAYAISEREALSDITFEVSPGKHIAIVGASGAGKSTLLNLIVRFWDPTSGTITLNGHPVQQYALEDLRSLVSVVAQDTYLFNDTIRGNLLLARPEATEHELEQALQQAQLSDVIKQLPQGLSTWVGEQGLRLSGGERQRLAIARALLKDAPLLILDEPTANVDPLAEQSLLASFATLMQGRTTLLITHRLVNMERMDEILVLDAGCIVERGTHNELMQAHSLYFEMVQLQEGMLSLI